MQVNLNFNIRTPMNTVNTYRDLTFRDARHIVTLANRLSYYRHATITINNPNALSGMLNRVDASIRNRSGWRIFLDIITLQFIKIFMIKKLLPTLILRMNTIANNAQANNGVNNADDDEEQDPVQPLPKPQMDTWQDTCEFKLDLMLRAYEHFRITRDQQDATKGHQPQWKKTAQEVDDFFQDRIRRLNADENIAVPMYYHASRAGTDLIAGSAKLIQSAYGAQGPGVYFSNSDESHSGYGPCTFAMDPSQVESCQTTYANHGGACAVTGEEAALWMCAQEDIDLDPSKIAYVIVPDDNKTSSEKLKKFWEEGNFFVDPMPRPAADWIRTSMKGVHIHNLPKKWTSYGTGYRAPTYLNKIVAN